MTDWLWSTAVYSAALIGLAGVVGLIWPFRRLYRKSRLRALIMLAAGIAVATGLAMITPSATSSGERNGIDDFAPVFQFREQHSTIVAAPPERVFAAIRAVTADEIALFNLFTRIRRLGRPGPESILNAPGQQPIIDVAVRSGFHLLVDRPPHEVAIGSVVVAPPRIAPPLDEAHRQRFTSEDFKALVQPGFAKATANFSVHDLGNGSSRLDTETRIFATDRTALRRFTAYWRIIFPGSSILRSTWLSAIKRRAERPTF
ncbi:MAG: hypothetical protein ABI024_00845 [Vicinamibacterales bacterium]